MPVGHDDLPPLLERADELGLLFALLDGPACRLALVRGEAGIGKTALLLHLARSVAERGGSVWWGACSSLGPGRPLGPLLGILGADAMFDPDETVADLVATLDRRTPS